MPDRHPGEDMLLDLALGDVAEPDDEELTRHLAVCGVCRDSYDDLSRSIDQTLAAAPQIHPSPGFDQTVLAAMGMAGDDDSGPETARRAGEPGRRKVTTRRPVLTAVAACLAGLAIGFGGSLLVEQSDDDAPPVASAGTPLVTPEGATVGTAALSYFEDQRVIVVTATDGGGVEYECRLRFADGSTETVGQWLVPDSGATWIMPAPYRESVTVEIVDGTGSVWSSADL